MNLDQVSAVIRPRSYAESIDLGFTMVRAWWRPIYGTWVVLVLPVAALLFLTLYELPWVAALVLWWLKPLFDRAPLFVLSRALFGATPTVGQTLRAMPGQLGRDAVLALTLYRLDWLRSFRLPIWQLEGIRGYRRNKRTRVLIKSVHKEFSGEGGHVAELLGMTCLAFELVLTLVPLGLVSALLPAAQLEVIGEAFGDPLTPGHLPVWWSTLAAWLLAMSAIEPFYVAAGFGLYVNRRTRLEAWDLEVVFRRLAARHRAVGGRVAVVLLCLVAWGSFSLGNPPDPVPTAVPEVATTDGAGGAPDAAETIREVLADPVFGGEVTRKVVDLRLDSDEPSGPGLGFLGLGAAVAEVLATLLWVLLIAGIVGLVIAVIVRASRMAAPLVPSIEPAEPPDVVLGMEVKRETLPDDVVGSARALWAEGARQDAVRLLYRAALARLIADGLPIKVSATEGDCLRLAAAHVGPDGHDYFRLLTETWQRGTYGHEVPPDTAGERLLDVWSQHFESRA